MKFYLNFYEDSGRLWKSTNMLDDSTPYIEVEKDIVVDFNTGKKDLNDYVVVPSTKPNQTYELRFLHKEIDGYDVERSIHHIEKDMAMIKRVLWSVGFLVFSNLLGIIISIVY